MPELTDAIFLLNFLFSGGPQGPCEDASDTNDDGLLDISDAVYLLLFLFTGGDPPPPPFPDPDLDPTVDDMICVP